MRKYKVKFNLQFNGEVAKTFKFGITAGTEGKAFDKAEDMIKSRMTHKILSIEKDSTVEDITEKDVKNMRSNMEKMQSVDPQNMTESEIDDLIEFMDDFKHMMETLKRMKKWD